MKKAIIHQFDPVIYPVRLWVTITENLEAIAERFDEHPSGKRFNVANASSMEAFVTQVTQKKDGYIGFIVVFQKRCYCSLKTASHESAHVARFMWNHLNEIDTGIEADAYLIGWVADCIDKVLKIKTNTYKNDTKIKV